MATMRAVGSAHAAWAGVAATSNPNAVRPAAIPSTPGDMWQLFYHSSWTRRQLLRGDANDGELRSGVDRRTVAQRPIKASRSIVRMVRFDRLKEAGGLGPAACIELIDRIGEA